jgi:hypothetical protein
MKGEGTDHHPADHGSASQTETVAGNGSPGARLLVVDNHALLRVHALARARPRGCRRGEPAHR